MAKKLRDMLGGRVLSDAKNLRRFSRDYSIYEISPLLVAMPADIEDLQKIITFAAAEGLPVTPRGGGSGTAGSSLGPGIVIALPPEGPWREITEVAGPGDALHVRAGAGVLHNDLQDFLRARGYFLPADVTSAGISRIGGNISTKASGPHALKYGAIDRFLVALEFITPQGEMVNTADPGTIPKPLMDKVVDLAGRVRQDEEAAKLLAARAHLKTASGYNMFTFLWDTQPAALLSGLLAGSVGTLGFITGATLLSETYESERATMLIHLDDLVEAGRAVCSILEAGPAAIEIMSRETVRIVVKRSGPDPVLTPAAHLLFVEFVGPDLAAQISRVKRILLAEGFRTVRKPVIYSTDEEAAKVWNLRRQLLPLVSNPEPGFRALAVVNDVGVDPRWLADCIEDLQKVFRKQRIEAAIYGHAGNGNLHLRPFFDLRQPDLKDRIQLLADSVYEVIFRYGGTITGEHGMGRLRAPYLRREWGDAMYGYMQELKGIFDPQGLFNPGVMFSDGSITENIRPDLLRS